MWCVFVFYFLLHYYCVLWCFNWCLFMQDFSTLFVQTVSGVEKQQYVAFKKNDC